MKNSHKSKFDQVPLQVSETFEKLKYLYPGFGFQTTDPNSMRFVENRTFEKNFYKVLQLESQKRQEDYESLGGLAPVYRHKHLRHSSTGA